ncbi:MAG: hypothetical protein ACFE8J_19650 [Candidatus Heimdallarchaeota archaeon]
MFDKGCWECGAELGIDEQICPQCGFDFNSSAHVKPKCPFCKKELHIYDFYATKLDKKRRVKFRGFKGEYTRRKKMWYCPFCGSILGFSEWNTGQVK